jgi:hypothetical protein
VYSICKHKALSFKPQYHKKRMYIHERKKFRQDSMFSHKIRVILLCHKLIGMLVFHFSYDLLAKIYKALLTFSYHMTFMNH